MQTNIQNEKNVLHKLADAGDAIRQKHKMLKLNKNNIESAMNEVFYPIVEPLQKLVGKTTPAHPLNAEEKYIKKNNVSSKVKKLSVIVESVLVTIQLMIMMIVLMNTSVLLLRMEQNCYINI